MEKRNRDASAVYGTPGTYEEIMKHTKEIKEQKGTEAEERAKYEAGFLYFPGKGTNYGEAKAYTDKIIKGQLIEILS